MGYKGNISTVSIKTGTVGIADHAFSYSGLSQVTIPSSVRYVGTEAFYDTTLWNSADYNAVIYAGNWAVGYSGYTTGELTFRPDTVGIADTAFNSSSLSVTIPASVQYIGNYAFNNCYYLSYITIKRTASSGITKLGIYTFHDYSYYLSNIYVPANSISEYKAAENWSNYAQYIRAAA